MFGKKSRQRKSIQEAYAKLTLEDFRTKTLKELEEICGIPPDPCVLAWGKKMDKMRKKYDKVMKRFGIT